MTNIRRHGRVRAQADTDTLRHRALQLVWRRSTAALTLLFLVGSVSAAAQAVTGPHTQINLTSENASIMPGRPFWVGLHFTLEPKWHIYWINPGDSGEPPVVEWKLPPGFRAGEIQWPAPRRIEAFSLVDYGYLGDVLLPVLIHPSAGLRAGTKVELSATVKWLVCSNSCIPAQGKISLELPVETGVPHPNPAARQIFERARVSLPKPVPAGWRVSAVSAPNDFILSIDSARPHRDAVFFPLAAEQIKDAAPQQVLTQGRRLELQLRKSDLLTKPLSVLSGVVVFPSGPAFVVHARVEQESRSSARRSRGT